jgi:hypothetical protein
MVPIHKLDTWMPVFPKKQYSILNLLLLYVPNPDRPVVAKRKSRFIGELKIEDLWHKSFANMIFQ